MTDLDAAVAAVLDAIGPIPTPQAPPSAELTRADVWDPTGEEAAALAAHHAANGHADDDTATPGQGATAPQSAVERLQGAALTTEAIRSLPPPRWLVEGYLIRDSLALLYGPSGTYKTFAGVDLALHLATSSWWHGHEITAPGTTLYVIAEGVSGIGARIDAWQQHHRIVDLGRHAPVTWLPRAVNLADALEAAALAEYAAALRPDLIVIDTLARCTLGAEENSARDMGVVVANLDALRRATGACVLSVHHTGKDGTTARGSSALKAGMDTALELSADPLSLKVAKQKDAPEAHPLGLTPLPVALGDDRRSVVLVRSSQIAQGDALGANDGLVLDALVSVAALGAVSASTWKSVAGLADSSFYRSVGRLVGRGYVVKSGTDARPTYAPTQVTDDNPVTDHGDF